MEILKIAIFGNFKIAVFGNFKIAVFGNFEIAIVGNFKNFLFLVIWKNYHFWKLPFLVISEKIAFFGHFWKFSSFGHSIKNFLFWSYQSFPILVIFFFGNNLIPSSKEALLHLDPCQNRNYTSPGDLVFELQEPWSTRSLLGVHEPQGATTQTHVDVLLGVITTTVSTTDLTKGVEWRGARVREQVPGSNGEKRRGSVDYKCWNDARCMQQRENR